MAITLVITDVGRAEVINAAQNGFAPVEITQVGFGVGKYTADPTQTALQDEFKRLSTISGGAISPTAIHVTARDSGPDAYSVFELGVYLASGTLFAVYSQNTPIIDKAGASVALLAIDIELTGDVTPEMVTFGDTNFQLNSATETSEGLVQLATVAEVVAGTDATKAVTPKGVKAAVDAVDLSEYARAEVLPTDSLASKDAGLYSTLTGGAARLYAVLPSLTNGGQTQRIALSLIDEDDQGSQVAKLLSSTDDWATVTPTLTFLTRSAGDDYYTSRANNLQDLDDHAAARSNLGVARATQAEAEAGALDNVTMSPLRTMQAIDQRVPTLIGSQRPWATQAEAEAQASTDTVISPLRARQSVLSMMAPPSAPVSTSLTTIMSPRTTVLAVDQLRPDYIEYSGATLFGGWIEYSNGRYEEWGTRTIGVPSGGPTEPMTIQIELNTNVKASKRSYSVTPRLNPHARVVTEIQAVGEKHINITFSPPLVGDGNTFINFDWRIIGSTI